MPARDRSGKKTPVDEISQSFQQAGQRDQVKLSLHIAPKSIVQRRKK